jgi:hypothetical protein
MVGKPKVLRADDGRKAAFKEGYALQQPYQGKINE